MKRFQTTALLTSAAFLCLTGATQHTAQAGTPANLRADSRVSDAEEQPTPELRRIMFARDGGSIGCDFLVGDEEVFVRFDHSLNTKTEGRMYSFGRLIEFDSDEEAKLFDIFERFLDTALTDEEKQGLADGTLSFTDFDTEAERNAAMFYGIYRGYLRLKEDAGGDSE